MTSIFKQNISRDFDKAAKSYDEHAIVQRKAADHLFSLVKGCITNDNKILDAGCGTGYFHELLRKNKIYCPLFQTDIAYNMCKKSEEYASPIEYGGTYTFSSDIENMPLAMNSIDMVFSSLVVQWADIEKVLEQISKILIPKGKVAIATIGSGTLAELKELSQGILNINDDFKTEEEHKNLFLKAGFKNIQTQTQTIKIEHESLKKLLVSIKAVGATYKAKRHSQYLGKDYFIQLEQRYREKFSNNKKLIASWKVIHITADKPKE